MKVGELLVFRVALLEVFEVAVAGGLVVGEDVLLLGFELEVLLVFAALVDDDVVDLVIVLAHLQGVEVVGPALHHLHAGGQMRGAVVSPAVGVLHGVRELVLN